MPCSKLAKAIAQKNGITEQEAKVVVQLIYEYALDMFIATRKCTVPGLFTIKSCRLRPAYMINGKTDRRKWPVHYKTKVRLSKSFLKAIMS